MRLTQEQYMQEIQKLVGDSTDDATLKTVQDLTDTYKELSSAGQEDWKKKYETNDAEWRKTYKDTFFNGVPEGDKNKNIDFNKNRNDEPTITINDLFKKKGVK